LELSSLKNEIAIWSSARLDVLVISCKPRSGAASYIGHCLEFGRGALLHVRQGPVEIGERRSGLDSYSFTCRFGYVHNEKGDSLLELAMERAVRHQCRRPFARAAEHRRAGLAQEAYQDRDFLMNSSARWRPRGSCSRKRPLYLTSLYHRPTARHRATGFTCRTLLS
jgi:hypothetical protein